MVVRDDRKDAVVVEMIETRCCGGGDEMKRWRRGRDAVVVEMR